MTVSNETRKRIEDFSREQSRYYLDRAHMTYWEKLQNKAEQTQRKVAKKAERFKFRSQQSEEAQGDLMLYMNDFMEDLIAQGATEEEAFEQARKELACGSGSNAAMSLQDRYAERLYDYGVYGEDQPFSEFMDYTDALDGNTNSRSAARVRMTVSIGLLFGGFPPIGAVVGVLIGFLGSGGVDGFLTGGWIYTLIGLVAGAVVGVGIAMICVALIAVARR